jgi:4-oxalocrotonate tautomerase
MIFRHSADVKPVASAGSADNRRTDMPFINIKVAGQTLAPEQLRRLHVEASGLMAGAMRKKHELTSVLVEQVPVAGWAVNGKPVPIAAHLDVKVTAGTNTAEEKARFVAAATALLRDVLGGDLPVATYVVIDEVPGDAWGYDGLTQEQRRAAQAA